MDPAESTHHNAAHETPPSDSKRLKTAASKQHEDSVTPSNAQIRESEAVYPPAAADPASGPDRGETAVVNGVSYRSAFGLRLAKMPPAASVRRAEASARRRARR